MMRAEPSADRALDWLVGHLDLFNPMDGNVEIQRSRLKPLTELALLLTCMSMRETWQGDRRVSVVGNLIARTHVSEDMRSHLIRHSDAFVPHVLRAISLKQIALIDWDDEQVLLQRLLECSNVLFTERLPFQELELRYALEGAGLVHSQPSVATLFRRTIASHLCPTVYMTEYDAYTLTHAIFYATSFGHEPLSIAAIQRQRLEVALRNLLDTYLYVGQWDLVAELLFACCCLAAKDSRQYREALIALGGLQGADGSMPGPATARPLMENRGEQLRERFFDWSYHTTIVAAMLALTSDARF